MLNICNPRIRGIDRSNIAMFKLLCGEDFYPNVVLCTTHWDQLEFLSDGVSRERELQHNLQFWGELAARGSKVKRIEVEGNTDSPTQKDLDIVQEIARNHHPRVLHAQVQMNNGLQPSETSAAREEVVWNLYLTQQRERMMEMLQRARTSVREQLAQNQAQLQREFEDFEANVSQEDRDARLQLARAVEQVEFERTQLEKRINGEGTRYPARRSDEHKRKMEDLLREQQSLDEERARRIGELEDRKEKGYKEAERKCKRKKSEQLICGGPKKGGCGRNIDTRKEQYYRKSYTKSSAFV